jgi:hypothetical protein
MTSFTETDQMPCACEKGKKASKQTQHVCSAKEEEEEEEEEEVHICLILSAYFLRKTDFYSNYGSLER